MRLAHQFQGQGHRYHRPHRNASCFSNSFLFLKTNDYMPSIDNGRQACEVKAGIGVTAGNTVWSTPERLECEVLQKARYINTLPLLLGKIKFAQLMPPTHLSSCSVYVAWLYYLLCMALSFEHTHRQIDIQTDRQTRQTHRQIAPSLCSPFIAIQLNSTSSWVASL